MQSNRAALGTRAGLLDSLSPLRVLDRGYSLAFRQGRLLTSAAEVQPDDQINLRLRDGSLTAAVLRVEGE